MKQPYLPGVCAVKGLKGRGVLWCLAIEVQPHHGTGIWEPETHPGFAEIPQRKATTLETVVMAAAVQADSLSPTSWLPFLPSAPAT